MKSTEKIALGLSKALLVDALERQHHLLKMCRQLGLPTISYSNNPNAEVRKAVEEYVSKLEIVSYQMPERKALRDILLHQGLIE